MKMLRTKFIESFSTSSKPFCSVNACKELVDKWKEDDWHTHEPCTTYKGIQPNNYYSGYKATIKPFIKYGQQYTIRNSKANC